MSTSETESSSTSRTRPTYEQVAAQAVKKWSGQEVNERWLWWKKQNPELPEETIPFIEELEQADIELPVCTVVCTGWAGVPTVTADPELLKKWAEEMEAASLLPLPSEEDSAYYDNVVNGIEYGPGKPILWERKIAFEDDEWFGDPPPDKVQTLPKGTWFIARDPYVKNSDPKLFVSDGTRSAGIPAVQNPDGSWRCGEGEASKSD